MYDYVVEMTKKHKGDDDEKVWREIDFSIISDELYIVSGRERREVTAEVRETFRKKYRKYVINRMENIGSGLAIVMFQGTYKRIIPRNSPRNGMRYIEDNLRQVTKQLPKLPKGERYVFPALKIIIAEYGVDFFVFPK